jgi:ABC-type transporter Mla MlaB component
VVAAAVAWHRPAEVRLDLAGVRFVDARGAAGLIACHGLAAAAGADFAVSPAGRVVTDLLRLARLEHLLRPEPEPGAWPLTTLPMLEEDR